MTPTKQARKAVFVVIALSTTMLLVSLLVICAFSPAISSLHNSPRPAAQPKTRGGT